ncbi:MAG: iron chaperone [Desulfitibacter sp. BRH_c19]|nr:MAG: iron chaperone [Desulfitibacter sp. BRH_c19]
MKDFQTFLDSIDDPDKRERMDDILNYVKEKFPQLKEEIKWNEPMFSNHGTFIIGFSIAKGHIAVAPEPVVISLFEKEIEEAGYSHTQGLFRIKWTDKVDFDLLYKIVAYNIEDKKDMTKFWRK